MSVPPHLASAPNINHLWAALLVEELVRQGTTFFVVCPGSRSTPLAVAVAQNPRAEALVHWDERAAGFVALGWGRATGRPAAVVTTSGTAVANLLPAAVEADADHVPLLLLTADRPPELRETGANQTIRQPPIFQDVARWTLDWPVPTPDVSPRWVLSTASHAVHRAASGPVHLNLPFREPLGAQPDGVDDDYLRDIDGWTSARPQSSAEAITARAALSSLPRTERGVIVVGALPGTSSEQHLIAFDIDAIAHRIGWPVLPDVRTPFRAGADDDLSELDDEPDLAALAAHLRPGVVVPNVDLLLSAEHAPEFLRPDAVLYVGGRLTSKRLARYLRATAPRAFVRLHQQDQRVPLDDVVTEAVHADLRASLSALGKACEQIRKRGTQWEWPRSWMIASRVTEAVVASHMDGLSEPAVARVVTRRFPAVVAGASMPIRDVEAYAPVVRSHTLRVVANRGASGIDGTVATAVGYDRGQSLPPVVLLGDLALLHDQTSLALLRESRPIIVVVLNNDGGGIFHRLPIASGPGALADDTFEQFFGTPHGLTFEHAAAQVGLAYHQPETLDAFEVVLADARKSRASALIEVRTSREEQAVLRTRIEAEVAAAVARVGPPWHDLP
ncbi:MAG: 2-succinyl-5-enolpyruvyl-6-hydroxy-3-cyclohexene-1-carboxylic-acid synthase [Bacteroidota bacterium]